MRIIELFVNYTELIDTSITVQGWVITTRTQKEISFVKLNDGSHPDGIQIVINGSEKYNIGSSLCIEGILKKSPADGQLFELHSTNITVLGQCDPLEYPLSKSKMNLDYLRNFAHLRLRTSTFGSVFRIKSSISHATDLFFEKNNYFHIDPNIITQNECEGGAGVFQITERDISVLSKLPLEKVEIKNEITNKIEKVKTDKYEWSSDHFGKPVYLTVSSQLQLETIACALGSVYTINKSFRSEHSSSNKHLSEFSHLEIETCFCDLYNLMDIGEKFIKFIGNYLLDHCNSDIDNLNKFTSKGLKERIQSIISSVFYRVEYSEAIKIVQSYKLNILFGDDLNSEAENCLTDHYKGPVFVYNWPIAIKSFYMKQDETNPDICNNFDLLMPYKVGELIGGSMRENSYEKLLQMMKKKGVSEEPLKFYTYLRKFGSVPHGGFGLGFDRLTMLFTGMENIRDTVAFPISYKNCEY
jgi:asparaginyl-tRNA synthetase